MQRSLYLRWKHNERVDWVEWDEAMSSIWLSGNDRLIGAAARLDDSFAEASRLIKHSEVETYLDWREVRSTMQDVHLAFINAARMDVMRSGKVTSTPLVERLRSQQREQVNVKPSPSTGHERGSRGPAS